MRLGLQLFACASPVLAADLGRLGDRLRRTYCAAARGAVQVMEAVNGTPVEQHLGGDFLACYSYDRVYS